jgi:FG-GAP-like repeat/Bacterial Ig-like domain
MDKGGYTPVWRGRLVLAVLALVTVLAGCGGGGGGGDSSGESPAAGGGDPTNLYPLAVGNRWVWQKTNSVSGSSTKIDEITRLATVQDTQVHVLQRRDAMTGLPEDDEEFRLKTDAGVFELARSTATADLLLGLRRIELLRFPLKAGMSHVALDQTGLDLGSDLDGDGVNERYAVRVQVTVSGVETVTVPAGTFPDAVHVVTVVRETVTLSRSSPLAATPTSTTTYDDWYAPGIGLVKNSELSVYPSGQERDSLELIDYRIGDRVKPGVSASSWTVVSPTDGQVPLVDQFPGRWSGPVAVRVTGHQVDPATAANGLVVTDASGQRLPGTTTAARMVRDDTIAWELSFTPTTPMPVGRYRVAVDPSVRDLAGRALTGTVEGSAAFTVLDRAAPIVLAWPSSVVVVPGEAVTAFAIDFNELLDPASVTLSAFRLTHHITRQTIPLTAVAVEGSRVRLTAPLTTPGYYVLDVGDTLRDLSGNTMAAASIGPFTTESSDRTAPALVTTAPASGVVGVSPDLTSITLDFDEPIAPASVTTAAIAVGDSRTTRLLSIVQDSPTRLRLGVMLMPGSTHRFGGSASGGLADVHGNETRFELILTTAGRMTPLQFAADVRTGDQPGFTKEIITADLDGNGRPSLIVLQAPVITAGVSEMLIYSPRTGLPLGAPQRVALTPPTSPMGRYCWLVGLAAGDVSGDGRPDLVLTYTEDCGTQVIVRDSLGRWTTSVVSLPATWVSPVLADLDGDGRLDLISLSRDTLTLDVARQRAAGGLEPVRSIALPSPGGYPAQSPYRAVQVTDLDGDGRSDVLLLTDDPTPDRRLMLLTQRADGTLAPARYLPAPRVFGEATQVNEIRIADLNRDGRSDVVMLSTSTVWTHLAYFHQQPDGSLVSPDTNGPQLPRSQIGRLIVADLNGDGRIDVGLAGNDQLVHALQGSAGLWAPEIAATEWFTSVMTAVDLDNDGLPDLVGVPRNALTSDAGDVRVQYQLASTLATTAPAAGVQAQRASALSVRQATGGRLGLGRTGLTRWRAASR